MRQRQYPPVQKPWLKKTSWSSNAPAGMKATQAIPAIPKDMELDKDARYSGVVTQYRKWSGFGFIRPERKGLVPGDKLYVKWTNLQSDDRFPFLLKDMEVEFGLMKWKHNGVESLNAKSVTLPGGMNIAVQDDVDLEKKSFVGGQNLRYTGTLKFYNPKRGFGYVSMDDGYALPEAVPKELRVEEVEVNSGGRRPKKYMENLAVEFGIVKTRKGTCMVYNMSLPGGVPILIENLENRQIIGSQSYRGKVDFMNWKQGWGLIKPDANVVLPPKVEAKLSESMLARTQKGKKVPPEKVIYFRKTDVQRGSDVKSGAAVTFQIYIDNMGVGAREIH